MDLGRTLRNGFLVWFQNSKLSELSGLSAGLSGLSELSAGLSGLSELSAGLSGLSELSAGLSGFSNFDKENSRQSWVPSQSGINILHGVYSEKIDLSYCPPPSHSKSFPIPHSNR